MEINYNPERNHLLIKKLKISSLLAFFSKCGKIRKQDPLASFASCLECENLLES